MNVRVLDDLLVLISLVSRSEGRRAVTNLSASTRDGLQSVA